MLEKKLLVVVFAVCLLGSSLVAAQISGWRIDSTGRYLDANPPIEWSAETNVVWKTPMPGTSNGSPTIVGDRIFVCSEPTNLVCVRASDGEILWQRTNTYLDVLNTLDPEKRAEIQRKMDEVDMENTAKELRSTEGRLGDTEEKLEELLEELPEDAEPERKAELEKKIEDLSKQLEQLEAKLEPVSEYVMPRTHEVNGYSSSTPASDGENVYVLFGTGTAACYDMDGNRKWIKQIEKPEEEWGHSASPLLVDDKVIVHVLNPIALDKETGEIVWKSESKPRWGTGVVTKIGDVDVIITANGDFLRASDGKVLAKDTSFVEFARPIVHDGIVYFIQHEGKAFKLPSEISDTITPEFLWETKPKDDRYYASSVYHEGLIYAIVRQGHFFSVIDAETGEVVYEEKLKLGKGEAFPSITLAGKYLFISIDDGTTVIMEPGREPKEIVRNSLEAFRGSPVFVGERVYIRGMEHLYCIGK